MGGPTSGTSLPEIIKERRVKSQAQLYPTWVHQPHRIPRINLLVCQQLQN